MSSLIVFIPAAPAHAGTDYDYVLTHDGQSVATHGRCKASLLPREGEVVAVLGVGQLSWHKVRLPKGALSARAARHTPRLRAALDALLEDAVLDDCANLHLALAAQAQPDGAWLVAACAKAPLQAHLQCLESAGRSVARIVPELEPGPTQGHALHSASVARLALVTPDAVAPLPLNASTAQLLSGETPLWAEPACASAAEQLCRRSAQLLQREQRWLNAAASDWDLAQFDLVSSSQARQLKRLSQTWHALVHAPQWRLVRWGVALLLLVQVLGLNTWAWHEREGLRSLRAQMQQTLTQTFPGVRTVIDAPAQMERELALLRRASGAASRSDMESLLATLAQAMPGDQTPAALDYSGGTLRVKGLRLGAQEWPAMQERLRALGATGTLEADTLTLGVSAP